MEKNIGELSNDFDNGSIVIARKGLSIFIEAIDKFKSVQNENIEIIKDKIILAKPSMTALKNVVEEAFQLFNDGIEANEIKLRIENKLNSATGKCIEKAKEYFNQNNCTTFVTCSYSSTVMKFFESLQKSHYQFKVIAFESVWKNKDYANTVVEKCFDFGIDANRLNKTELKNSKIGCGIIGADSVVPGKGIINGTPSEQFAGILNDMGKPLFVLAESFKFTNSIHQSDGFDFVHMGLIEKVFSDD